MKQLETESKHVEHYLWTENDVTTKYQQQVDTLQQEIVQLKDEMREKNEMIQEFEEQLKNGKILKSPSEDEIEQVEGNVEAYCFYLALII